ncbi:MAG: HsdR [Proteobacteria bacterium]|nr:HsdR [Pseudomonadota bacterium]
MGSFVRAYDFLSQIIDYGDTDLEKHYIFYKCLIPLIREQGGTDKLDLSDLVLTHHKVRSLGQANIGLGADGQDHVLKPINVGTGEPRPDEYLSLSALIRRMNDLFEGEVTDADKVAYAQHIAGKMMEDEVLAEQAKQNTKEQFEGGHFKSAYMDAVVDGFDNYKSMAEQVMGNDDVKEKFGKLLLDMVYAGLRARNVPPGQAGVA